MRHRRKGRVLGRSPAHQRALLRNLASALMLTARKADADEVGAAKVPGRIVTTLAKAKEVRPLVERCVTIAKHGLAAASRAAVHGTTAARDSAAWKQWRTSDAWKQWAAAMAPAVKARRRVVQLLGDKKAARVVFEEIAPRFVDRPGGYTRILKLATPRLGDAGPRALLEFVGQDSAAARPQRPKVDSARPVST
ncbi:MAG: bL17 family ribosomal protein [Planctomycetota bacterium]|nr:50S ribosomal protein L17 [Planctomycetota bacterium]